MLSPAVLFALLAASDPLERWLGSLATAKTGVAHDAVETKPSSACGGMGVFARRPLASREVLAVIPSRCTVTAADSELLPVPVRASAGMSPKNCEAATIAALLVLARFSSDSAEARVRWGPFVDSMPWASSESDPMHEHPLVVAHREDDPDLVSPGALDLVRRIAQAARASLDDTLGSDDALFDRCYRAALLVSTRAFSFPRRPYVMVPFADNLNHPSQTALAALGPAGRRWTAAGLRDACISRSIDDHGAVTVYAPAALEIFEGDELFTWYGNAGYGAPTREEGEEGLRAFVTSYGFSPWD